MSTTSHNYANAEEAAVDLALGDIDREGSAGDARRFMEALATHGHAVVDRDKGEQIALLRSRRPSSMHYVPWWQVNVLLLVTNLLVVTANAAKGDAAWFNIAASFVFAGLTVHAYRSLRRHEKEMRR